jgi:glycosyltransferase involved in cell wall biosynthesis
MGTALIVDSALKSMGGHNYTYTSLVRTALQNKGWSVDVLAHKALPRALAEAGSFTPVFSNGAYDFPCARGTVRNLLFVYAQSVIFHDELELALELAPHCYDLIFSHTLADFELIAWSRLLRSYPLQSHLSILLRNTARYRAMPWWKRSVHPYHRMRPAHLAAIARRLGKRFSLVTDSEALSLDYESVVPGPVRTLPIPVPPGLYKSSYEHNESASVIERYQLAADSGLVIGYLGDTRRQKGFYLLSDVVAQVTKRHPRVRFVLQCPHSAYDRDLRADETVRLRELAERLPEQITLIPEALDGEDYQALLRRMQLVLVPYLREGYIEPTSGIFAEALAVAKPVVVPSGTWMAHELGASGAGLSFESGNSDDLTRRICEIVGNYDHFAARAREFAPRWRDFHNPDRLVELLLQPVKACE